MRESRLPGFAPIELQEIKVLFNQHPVTSTQKTSLSIYDKELFQNRSPEYQKVFNVFNSEYKWNGYWNGLFYSALIMGAVPIQL